MPAVAVVLDACVLYPAALRDTLLRAAEAGWYRPVWSEEILAEAQRNLVARHAITSEQADRLFNAMREAFPEAAVTGYRRIIPQMLTHEKDRHVAAAAVIAKARTIVTLNVGDFPRLALERYGIEVQTPDEFLGDLLDHNPGEMTSVVVMQAKALRSPHLTLGEILDDIALQAPIFARRVADLLGPSMGGR